MSDINEGGHQRQHRKLCFASTAQQSQTEGSPYNQWVIIQRLRLPASLEIAG